MQPNDISRFCDTELAQSIPVPPYQSTQHGFPEPDPSLGGDPRKVTAINGGGSEGVYAEGATRLSAMEKIPIVGTPLIDEASKPPFQEGAISKYEAMGASPTRGMTFQVKKTNWDGRKDSPISRFPNEVLIHALSFLDPQTLLTVALISRRFHTLVTSSHAWRAAFSRYFPSSAVTSLFGAHESAAYSSSHDRRYFTLLSGSVNNAWRKEYILRTRLLRSLAKGKANISTNHATPISRNSHGSMVITYPAATGSWSVSHMVANFMPGGVRLLHASVHTPGVVSASDPTIGKVERPPLAEAFMRTQSGPDFHQPLLGLQGFEVATDMGTLGVMDLSEDIGWIYGENVPSGKVYIHPYPSPYIASAPPGIYIRPDHESIDGFQPVVTSVWIAKKRLTGVLETTEGRVGFVVGTSRGVVSIYGLSFRKDKRSTSQIKNRVSPGVPIVSIKVDDNYSAKRMKQNKVCIVVINALGEVYYLRNLSSSWRIISQTARVSTSLYNSVFIPPTKDLAQIKQTNWEEERDTRLMKMGYDQVKDIWGGWGMDWFIEVDWADQNVVLGKKQSVERHPRIQDDAVKAGLYRYHLVLHTRSAKNENMSLCKVVVSPKGSTCEAEGMQHSVLGGIIDLGEPTDDFCIGKDAIPSVPKDEIHDIWVATRYKFGGNNMHIITATAMDNSTLALLSDREDPETKAEVPGGSARLFTVGTDMGSVFVWNIRSPVSSSITDVTDIQLPLRAIHTDSPQISSLALSSLYLVHGGTDGLVQAWDPLASTLLPIRNIHSKFSSRARRRIAQADAGAQEEFGIGDNQFAARCLTLDPDATSLRGTVALGTLIRYWCFSSSSSDSTKKRRKSAPKSRASGTTSRDRGAIKNVIESEAGYLLGLKEQERKEKEVFQNRYGVTSGREALSEEDMVEYATMISREAFELESRGSIADSDSIDSNRTVTPDAALSVSSYGTADEYKSPIEDQDMELAEALRLSLLESGDGSKIHQIEDVWEDADYLYSDFGSMRYNSPPLYTIASSSSSKPNKSYRSTSSSMRNPGWERLTLGQADEWPSVGEKGKGKGKGHDHSKAEEEFETELEVAIRLSLMEEEERKGIMEALKER